MLLKAVVITLLTAATTLGLGGDTSIIDNCRNVSHVTWSRDHEARLANLTLEQPLTSRQELTTNFNIAYVPL
jgi:hypothetical protein